MVGRDYALMVEYEVSCWLNVDKRFSVKGLNPGVISKG